MCSYVAIDKAQVTVVKLFSTKLCKKNFPKVLWCRDLESRGDPKDGNTPPNVKDANVRSKQGIFQRQDTFRSETIELPHLFHSYICLFSKQLVYHLRVTFLRCLLCQLLLQ